MRVKNRRRRSVVLHRKSISVHLPPLARSGEHPTAPATSACGAIGTDLPFVKSGFAPEVIEDEGLDLGEAAERGEVGAVGARLGEFVTGRWRRLQSDARRARRSTRSSPATAASSARTFSGTARARLDASAASKARSSTSTRRTSRRARRVCPALARSSAMPARRPARCTRRTSGPSSGPTTARESSILRARFASRQRTEAKVGTRSQADGIVVVGLTTGADVEVVGGSELTVLVLVDVVTGASDELDVELTVVVDTSGAVVLVVDEEPTAVELVVDEEVDDEVAELLDVEVTGMEVDVRDTEVEVTDTEVEVLLVGGVVALLVVEIEVVVDDEVGVGAVVVGSVDVLVDTVVLDVDGAVEGTVEVALVAVVAVLAVVAEVDVGGGSVVSEVLLVVLVVVVANVPAKPPIWIRLSVGFPPNVVTKRSLPMRGSNSSPSGPTPKADAKTRSAGDVVPSTGSPECASMGSPL